MKSVLVTSLVCFCLSLNSIAETTEKKFSALMNEVGLKAADKGLNSFRLETPSDSTDVLWKYENKGKLIFFQSKRIDSETDAAAVQMQIDLQLNAIESLYKDGVTPYQGAITNTQSCPNDRKPIREEQAIEGIKIFKVAAAVSDRNSFGNCFDKNPRGGSVALFYNPSSHQLVTIKLFDKNVKTSQKEISKLLSGIKTAKK